MGCDWYEFESVAGVGRIIETTYGDIESGQYFFRQSLLKRSEDGNNWCGTLDLSDEPIDDDEPYIAVVFDGPTINGSISAPGPYEIEEHFVEIKTGPNNQLLICASHIIPYICPPEPDDERD